MGVNLIVGYAGQETLAQAAFLGIGAYLTARHQGGLPFGVSFAASGLLAFIIGIALGFPALRVQKHYSPSSPSPSRLCWLVFRNEQAHRRRHGHPRHQAASLFGLPLRHPVGFYWFVLAIAAAMTFVLWWIVRSPWGRAFTALRENPLRAESLGIDVRLYTLLAFALGSRLRWHGRQPYAPLVEFIDPSPFALGPSLLFMLMVVIGGAALSSGLRRRRHRRAPAGMAARLGDLVPADLCRDGDGHDGLFPAAGLACRPIPCVPARRKRPS